MEAPDVELIARCLAGDSAAWSLLIARYQRLIYSVARAICRDRQDADDVFQHVCLEWYQQLAQVRNAQALPAWLITVTRRRAYATLRAGKESVALDMDIAASEDRIAEIDQEHAVAIALNQLQERCRLLLELLYLDPDGPSYAEVARRLEMPVSSIGPTRARCMEKLRKLFDPE